jgi:membrane-associated phospholipid phosphatase
MNKEKLFLEIMYLFSSSQNVLFYIFVMITLIDFNLYSLILILITFLKTFVSRLVKKKVSKYKIGERPKKAYNCNTYNCGGKSTSGGFPSGHMMILGIITPIILLQTDNPKILRLMALVIFTTALGRYYTNCHTLIQILSGLIIGLIIGYLLYNVDLYIELNWKLYKDEKVKFFNKIKETIPE